MNVTRTLSVCSALGLGCLLASAAEYEITQIGGLPGFDGEHRAMGINSAGKVIGYSSVPGFSQGWTWSGPGTMTALPHGNGFISASFGYGINESGQVTGSAVIEGDRFAFRYTPGSGYTFMASVNSNQASGQGLNDSGSVVGFSTENDHVLATRWNPGQNGQFLPFYEISGESAGRDINNAGSTIGFSELNGVRRAVIFRNNGTLTDIHQDLPEGTTYSEGEAINNGGTAVGYYRRGEDLIHPFYIRGAGVHTIEEAEGFVTGRLTGISDLGVGVGFMRQSAAGQLHAAVWSEGTLMRDLNTLIEPNSGWQLNWAHGVNDNGWIVGDGTFNGVQTTFLLKPVPEPGTLAVLGIGLIACLRKTRRSPATQR